MITLFILYHTQQLLSNVESWKENIIWIGLSYDLTLYALNHNWSNKTCYLKDKISEFVQHQRHVYVCKGCKLNKYLFAEER